MIDFTIDTVIRRPVTDVFAYVTDPAKLATWQTNTVSVVQERPGGVTVGTRLREIHRAPGGKQLESLVEVSEYERDSTFALEMIEGALPLHAHIAFAAVDEGTRMRFRTHGQPTGAMRLAQPLLRRTLRRQFTSYCAQLRQMLESAPVG